MDPNEILEEPCMQYFDMKLFFIMYYVLISCGAGNI